jgi:hypothetical protein
MKKRDLLFVCTVMASMPATGQNSCTNADFETGTPTVITSSTQVTGWTITHGSNNMVQGGNCSLTLCCTMQPQNSMLINTSTGYIDPVIGSVYPIYSVYGSAQAPTGAASANPQLNFPMGGSQVLRLNNNNTSYDVERASKSILVSATNHMVDVAYMAVLYPGHGLCDAPAFMLSINGATCTTLHLSGSAGSTSLVAFYESQTGAAATPTTFSAIFSKWNVASVDLSQYMNQTVTIDVTAAGCTAGGHYGYGYVDMKCSAPPTLTANGSPFILTSGTVNVGLCPGNGSITAPGNYSSYQWSGPSGFTSTLSTITPTATGAYTLVLGQPGGCAFVTKTVNVVPPGTVNISGPSTTVAPGSTVVLTGSGASTYSWSTGANTNSTVVTPTTGANVYTVTGIDPYGCPYTLTFTVNAAVSSGLASQDLGRDLRLFPNPVKERLEIQAPVSLLHNTSVTIFDNKGQVVKVQVSSKAENVISIETGDLEAGVYLLYLNTENGFAGKRFVVE